MSITTGYKVQQALLSWAETAEVQTIPQMFELACRRNPSKMFLAAKKDGRYQGVSYQQTRDTVERLALGLLALGLQADDRVAQVSPNRPEWVYVDLAILSAGGIHVPIYPTLKPYQVAYIMNDAGARIATAATTEQLTGIIDEAEAVPSLEHVIVYEGVQVPTDTGRLKVHRFDEVLAMGESKRQELGEMLRQRTQALTATRVASLVYTSGTTGEPKGAMLMHGNFASNATMCAPLLELSPDDIELSFLPLCHVFERIAYYALLYTGATVYYAESIEKVGANMMEVHPTIVPSVPRVFEKIQGRVLDGVEQGSAIKKKIFAWAMRVGQTVREHRDQGRPLSVALYLAEKLAHKLVFSKIHDRTGGRIRLFISGGAPLRKDVAEFFGNAGFTICEGFGLTETSPVITFNRPEAVRFGTVGQTAPGVEVKIADDGEILARGPNIMLGYFNKPEDTRAVIEDDGFFHTGDIGHFDKDGYLQITDRKKELLVMSNGKNVAPQPIENLLKSSTYIEQAVVIGDNRNYITALVFPNFTTVEAWAKANGVSATGAALSREPKVLEFLRKHVEEMCRDLSQYEKVKKIALLENEMTQDSGELTPTLKFKRRVILENYKDLIESMYVDG